MGKYNWKDNYYGYDEASTKFIWLSVNGEKGIDPLRTTRERPLYFKGNVELKRDGDTKAILSSGVFNGRFSSQHQNVMLEVIGQGMGNTIWRKTGTSYGVYFRNLTIDSVIPKSGFWGTLEFRDCDIKTSVTHGAGIWLSGCKIRVMPYCTAYSPSTPGTISIIGIQNIELNLLRSNGVLYDKCEINIPTQDILKQSQTIYTAFNKCKFKIVDESEYTELIGSTAEELRENFIQRCEAQYLIVPPSTDPDVTEKADRWVFSNNSTLDGLVLVNSDIHKFEKSNLISFGYTGRRNEFISITEDSTTPASFSPAYASSNLDFKDQNISLKNNVDISTKLDLATKTNIIWLGGINKLNLVDIIHDFPKDYGLFLDSTDTIDFSPVEEIEAREYYIVRSEDTNKQTITYNNKTYSSAISEVNNIFVGVAEEKEFIKSSDKVRVYKLNDHTALHQTIKMRVVSHIPTEKIDPNKSLIKGYWYFVEHKTDQANTSDFVTYNGKQYKAGSSFLVGDITNFTATSGVHLRRCWKDNFDYNTETIDKDFWKNIQKPRWIHVVPDDLRCLMRNNNPLETEIKTDGEEYITTGHPAFYNLVLGSPGVKVPAFPITGAFIQLELHLTTLNPM